jgi:small subunit ribosomal protein S6
LRASERVDLSKDRRMRGGVHALCSGEPEPFSPQGGKSMTHYEITFIIASALENEQKEATVEMVKEIISNGGEVTKTNIWGTRKLAYPIQKRNDGYYVVMEFQAPPDLPKELDRRLKISDNVIRHLIVNKDEK